MFLTNLTDEVRDTLELVGITTIITTLNTENEALLKLGITPAPASPAA
jgi:anti-anti-sigma regulatory factor